MKKQNLFFLLLLLPFFGIAQEMEYQYFRAPVVGISMRGGNGVAVGNLGSCLVTSDGGATWSGRKTPVGANYSEVSMADDNTGWAVGAAGIIIKTSDGGDTWIQQNIGGTTADFRSVIAVSSMEAWVIGGGGTAVANYSRLLHTTDGGATWTDAWDATTIHPHLWGTATSGTLYFTTLYAGHQMNDSILVSVGGLSRIDTVATGGAGGKIIRYNTNTSTVQDVRTFKGSSHSFRDVYFADDQKGWVVGNFSSNKIGPGNTPGNYTLTTDGGATWSQLDTLLAVNTTWTSVIGVTGDSIVACNQSNTNVARSFDGGLNWQASAVGVGFWSRITKNTDNENLYMCGSAGQIYQSTDFSQFWTNQIGGPGLGMNDIIFTDENNGWAAADGGNTFRTTNGGATWTQVPSGVTTNVLISIATTTPSKVYAVTSSFSGNAIISSTDAGLTWTSYPVTGQSLQDIVFVDSMIGYTGGAQGRIFKTTDGGATWVALTNPLTTSHTVKAIAFTDALNGCVVTSGSTTVPHVILRTTDGGASWMYATLPTPTGTGTGVTTSVWLTDIEFADANVGYVCGRSATSSGFNSQLYKTTDGGATWTALTSTTSFWLASIEVFDANTLIVAGSGIHLYSNDGGASFQTFTPLIYSISNGLSSIPNSSGGKDVYFAYSHPLGSGAIVKSSFGQYYDDADGDGYGASSIMAFLPPSPTYIEVGGDCNDQVPTINPGATEVCDAVDNNCDGMINEGLDCIACDDMVLNVQASVLSNTTANISWTTVPGVVRHWIQWRVQGTTTWTVKSRAAYPNSYLALTGLLPNTVYEYQVRQGCSTSPSAAGPYSPIATFTTYTTDASCSEPTGLAYAYYTNGDATKVRVFANYEPSAYLGRYKLRYRAVGAPTYIERNLTKPSTVISGLLPSTTYEFSMSTRCGAGSTAFSPYAPDQSFTTLAATTPLAPNVEERDELFANSSVEVFPNPASDYIQVAYNGLPSMIRIFDLNGRAVLTMTPQAEELEVISVRALNSGFYTIQVINADGTMDVAKFVKQ